MVDVRRRKLAIIAMNVSVLAAALSWLLVIFSLIYSAAASHVLPVEDPDAHDVLGHDLHSTHLPHLHHENKDAQPER